MDTPGLLCSGLHCKDPPPPPILNLLLSLSASWDHTFRSISPQINCTIITLPHCRCTCSDVSYCLGMYLNHVVWGLGKWGKPQSWWVNLERCFLSLTLALLPAACGVTVMGGGRGCLQ